VFSIHYKTVTKVMAEREDSNTAVYCKCLDYQAFIGYLNAKSPFSDLGYRALSSTSEHFRDWNFDINGTHGTHDCVRMKGLLLYAWEV
jgi:hypothetical protein